MFAIIANPVAGGGRAKGRAEAIYAKLQALKIPCEMHFTKGIHHATELVKSFYEKGYRQFISVGGDGTHSEVTAGICGINDQSLKVGFIPAGTGNDFCRNLKMPSDTLKSLDVILKGYTQEVDGVSIGEGYCLNETGLGFDVDLLKRTQPLKKFLRGLAVYLLALIPTLFTFRSKKVTLTMDGKVLCQKVLLVGVSNGKYFGGGMKVAPMAQIDDGYLDVCVIDALSKFKIPFLLFQFIKGRHDKFKEVHFYKCREIKIESDEPLPIQADGDIIINTPLVCKILPQALNVFSPVIGTSSKSL